MQRNFVLMTDSGSDLPVSYLTEHDISLIPLGFTLDGVTYGGDDGAEMETKHFYDLLRRGALPKTFQATPAQAEDHLRPLLEAGRDVLLIAFSSGLSGTYDSYCTAVRALGEAFPARKVYVIDSRAASLGQGLLVDYAVRKADAGESIEQVRDEIEALKLHICHFFTVEDLFHLKRGGRVSGGAAAIGSLLRIKPVLHVDDAGHLVAVGKVMGRKKSISALADRLFELAELSADDPIFISHGDCPDDAAYLKQLICARLGERNVFIGEIGSVIGTHSGAGTVALFFRGKHR